MGLDLGLGLGLGARCPRFLLGKPADYGTAAAVEAGVTLACEEPAEWTSGLGNTTFTADTVNVRHGTQSIKFGGGASNLQLGYIDFGSGGELDLTNKIMALRIYIHPGSGVTDPKYMTLGRIYLTDSTALPRPHLNANGANSRWIDMPRLGDDYLNVITRDSADGWYEWHIPVTNMAEGGTMNLSAVRAVWLYFIFDKNDPPTKPVITVDWMAFYGSPLTAGKYAIRLDYITNWSDYEDLAVYSASTGVPLCWGIRPSSIVNGDQITVAQLQQIVANGDEIAIYAGNEWLEYPPGTVIPNNWRDKTWEQSIYQSNYNRAFFRQRAFAQDTSEVLFVSGGQGWTTRDHDCLLRRYFAVTSDLRAYTNPLNDPRYLYTSRFLDVEGVGLPADIPGLIAGAETSRTALILGAHVASADQRSCLKAVMDALAASSLEPKTFRQLYKGE